MNNLSILLYAAPVMDKVSLFIQICSIILIVISTLWLAFKPTKVLLENDSWFSGSRYSAGTTIHRLEYPFQSCVEENPKLRFLVSGLVLCLLSLLIPESTTVYLIASSEFGEQVVDTPQAQELFDNIFELLQAKLQEAL